MANPSEILDNEVETKGSRGKRDMAGKEAEGRLGWGSDAEAVGPVGVTAAVQTGIVQ